jgi:hypothetical protein
MLSYLDTVIGFAVIMLGVSLLITILTQIVSALFNHRGGNLLWGVKTLFANIDPAIYPKLTEQSEQIARKVLTHCLVSDSWFSNNRLAGWFAAKLPLVGRLFGRFQLASAIRSNELSSVLNHLADNALKGQAVADEIKSLLATSSAVFGSAAAAAGAGASGTGGGAATVVQGAVNRATAAAGRLEDWFDALMDRVSQKFAMYMRAWTVAFACAFAFGTGLNTPQLLTDLYNNGALREQLVNTAKPLTGTAQNVLASGPATPADTDTTSRKVIQNRATDAGTITGLFSGSFDLVQIRWPAAFTWKYFLGVLATAGLLSLGAPFWFNALKTLSNLRPVLATKQANEEAAS